METTFTFRNINASDALKTHTLDKLTKLGKYLVKPTQAHIIFGVERFNHVVEVTLNANGIQYISHEKSEDMYTSIDKAVAKLERQLKKYKERLKEHKS
ncbi:MAG: ribosome-associated translation inhibitor RaiA [Deltaproteobacteria bacterium]|nr:ribosome-associated translation inhibitor RaiA [Deltaproteobacteria bacterium]